MSLDRNFLLALTLALIIVITFFGNVLVCLSVIKVRKLRQPSNYLLISLAISDLCVACFVMPFGLYSSINDKWQLGRLLCNVYVLSDVTSCTASILNLCVISIDRYFAITRPLTYCIKRTSRLMLILIGLVWALACLISVPPLLISGNEYGTDEEPKCEVSQSVWYQLYATIFSFYIPLVVMIFIYYNIYTAAKKVVEAEQRATTGLQQQRQAYANRQLASLQNNLSAANGDKLNATAVAISLDKHASQNNITNSAADTNNHSIAQADLQQPQRQLQNTKTHQQQPIPPVSTTPNSKSTLQTTNAQNMSTTTRPQNSSIAADQHAPNAQQQQIINSKKISQLAITMKRQLREEKQQQQKSSVMRERKASITLGVIMSAFTICWLPFFIIALVRPFSDTVNNLPRAFVLLTLWLGYANSLLNPIIYVTFHHDFRNAFKHLLCCRCMTINEHIRKDEYTAHYAGLPAQRAPSLLQNNLGLEAAGPH